MNHMSFAVPFRKSDIADICWNFRVQSNREEILSVTKVKALL